MSKSQHRKYAGHWLVALVIGLTCGDYNSGAIAGSGVFFVYSTATQVHRPGNYGPVIWGPMIGGGIT
jgi:hypothetical protein